MGTSDNILFSSHYIFPILINSLKSAIIAINCTFFSIMAPDETWAVQLKIQTICINLCMPRKTSIIDWQSWFMFYCRYSFSVLWPIIWATVGSHWISLLMTPRNNLKGCLSYVPSQCSMISRGRIIFFMFQPETWYPR